MAKVLWVITPCIEEESYVDREASVEWEVQGDEVHVVVQSRVSVSNRPV